MLKIIRMIIASIVIVLACYSLITENFKFMPYMMFFLGVSMMISGLMELQRERKSLWGYMNIGISIFVFFVSIQMILFNK